MCVFKKLPSRYYASGGNLLFFLTCFPIPVVFPSSLSAFSRNAASPDRSQVFFPRFLLLAQSQIFCASWCIPGVLQVVRCHPYLELVSLLLFTVCVWPLGTEYFRYSQVIVQYPLVDVSIGNKKSPNSRGFFC